MKKSNESISLLDTEGVAKKLDISVTLFRKEIKLQPDFPRPVMLQKKSHPKWIDAELDDYIRAKQA